MKSAKHSFFGKRHRLSHCVRERFVRFQHDWAEDYARVNGLKKADVLLALSEVFKDRHASSALQQAANETER